MIVTEAAWEAAAEDYRASGLAIAELRRALQKIKNGTGDPVVIAAEALGDLRPEEPVEVEDTPEG